MTSDFTTIIPTVWIPSCPSTSIIEEVISSIFAQLPDSNIIICCDGIRAEIEEHRKDYEQYIDNLLEVYKDNENVRLLEFDKHTHQASMTRAALELVKTPYILFCEHDTPLVGDIPWSGFENVLEHTDIKTIRLSHDTSIYLEEGHKALHLDDAKPTDFLGIPLMRTSQWSQRPHVCKTEFYKWLIETYFEPDCITFIELVLHGVVANTYILHGEEGWKKFGVAIYHPEGNIQRSTHTNGNEGGPKFFEMRFRYPNGITPEGAPGQSR